MVNLKWSNFSWDLLVIIKYVDVQRNYITDKKEEWKDLHEIEKFEYVLSSAFSSEFKTLVYQLVFLTVRQHKFCNYTSEEYKCQSN